MDLKPAEMEARQLVVHTRNSVTVVRLTGDERTDAVIRRFCSRSGFVIEEFVREEVSHD